MISKLIKILFILLILLIIFNKKIISYYYLNKLSKWVERPVLIEQISFNYSGYIDIKNLEILNSKNFHFKNIFEADEISLKIDPKSLFSNLIVVEDLVITNPNFFLYIKLVKENNNAQEKSKYDDNIGLAKKLNEDLPDKIWPKKDRDINFIILKSKLLRPKTNIKVSNISKPTTTHLSTMNFNNYGNEKDYRHYKDVLKFILFDLYASTTDKKIKKILKEIYSF